MHRDQLLEQIRDLNRHTVGGFQTFFGILPANLPEGAKMLVLPDMHVPGHHRRIVRGVLDLAEYFRPHIVTFVGDVADAFTLSRFDKPPRFAMSLQRELEATRRVVDTFVEMSGCLHTFYVLGNHEERVRRYVMNPASGAGSLIDFTTREPLLSWHHLMHYGKEDRVTFIYDMMGAGGRGGALLINNDLDIHHGHIVRSNAGVSPRVDADITGRSTMTGHTHRTGIAARETTKRTLMSVELGYLADPRSPIVGYANLLNNWYHSVGTVEIIGGLPHVEVIPIKRVMVDGRPRYCFVFAGKVFYSSLR